MNLILFYWISAIQAILCFLGLYVLFRYKELKDRVQRLEEINDRGK
jgi:hypothetical protein